MASIAASPLANRNSDIAQVRRQALQADPWEVMIHTRIDPANMPADFLLQFPMFAGDETDLGLENCLPSPSMEHSS